MSNERRELFKIYRDKQEKFIYYTIALSVAAIGFSVVKSFDLQLDRNQIPLGLAIISWLLSVHKGFKFIQSDMSVLYANIALYDIAEGKSKISGTHPEAIQIGLDTVSKAMEDHAKRAASRGKWHIWFFYSGMILFIGWRVYEMYMLHYSTK